MRTEILHNGHRPVLSENFESSVEKPILLRTGCHEILSDRF